MSDKFEEYFELLMKWNAKINLVAVSDFDTFRRKHVDDAKHILPYLKNVKSVVDLGSGAGIPGIILKIEKPDLEIVLVEAKRKKVAFCEEAIRVLGLEGIEAVWGRAEDEGLMRGLGVFDAVVSRAAWKISQYVEVASRYIDRGGLCIAMKGPTWRKEMEGASTQIKGSCLINKTEVEYELSGDEKRCLVIMEKSGKKITI